jgi:hypothetical protein
MMVVFRFEAIWYYKDKILKTTKSWSKNHAYFKNKNTHFCFIQLSRNLLRFDDKLATFKDLNEKRRPYKIKQVFLTLDLIIS